MTALDFAIVAEIQPQGLPVQELRATLHNRGHRLSTVGLYERLAHLEAAGHVRIRVRHNVSLRIWEAA